MSRMRRRMMQEDAEVSTESLNDIMFFLMLFFLIVSTFANPNVINLTLPNAKSNTKLANQPITLSLNKDMVIFLNKEEVPLEDLEGRLKSLAQIKENPTVVLKFDKSLSIQDLVNVMNVVNDLKLRMVLAITPEKK